MPKQVIIPPGTTAPIAPFVPGDARRRGGLRLGHPAV